MPVNTRIIIFLVRDPYKPSFATVTGGGGDNPSYTTVVSCYTPKKTTNFPDKWWLEDYCFILEWSTFGRNVQFQVCTFVDYGNFHEKVV